MAARMRKRADGRYVVTVTYEDSEGAKGRHFVYGKTQAEANAKAKAARDRLEAAALDEGPLRRADQELRPSADRLDPNGPAPARRRDPDAARYGEGRHVRE